MPKINKKKTKTKETFYFLIFRYISILLVISFFIFVFGRRLISTIENLSYFQVKEIEAPFNFSKSVERYIVALKGKSIFHLDLDEMYSLFQRDYPGASHIRIIKKFPNRIVVQLEKRSAFAQVATGGSVVLVDPQGYLIARNNQGYEELPLISGSLHGNQDFSLGNMIVSRGLTSGLKILTHFQSTHSLSAYRIQRIDVSNLSKISLYITPPLNIFLDEDSSEKKFFTLGTILGNTKTDIKEIQYIDLRFKEPVINKK